MYRCDNCRQVFADPVADKGEPPVSYCPWCGDDSFFPVEACTECGVYFAENELFDGLCLGCLRKTIDYPAALAYMLTRECLRTFLEDHDGALATKAPPVALIQAFLSHEIEDTETGGTEFLNAIRDFILEDSICAHDYADWRDGHQ